MLALEGTPGSILCTQARAHRCGWTCPGVSKTLRYLGPEKVQRSWDPAGGQGGEGAERGLDGRTGVGTGNSTPKAAARRPSAIPAGPGRARAARGRGGFT